MQFSDMQHPILHTCNERQVSRLLTQKTPVHQSRPAFWLNSCGHRSSTFGIMPDVLVYNNHRYNFGIVDTTAISLLLSDNPPLQRRHHGGGFHNKSFRVGEVIPTHPFLLSIPFRAARIVLNLSPNRRSIRHAQLLLLVCQRVLPCLQLRFCQSRSRCFWWMVIQNCSDTNVRKTSRDQRNSASSFKPVQHPQACGETYRQYNVPSGGNRSDASWLLLRRRRSRTPEESDRIVQMQITGRSR